MPHRGRSKTRGGHVSSPFSMKPVSPIASYRVVELPEIFTLYLDAVEFALNGARRPEIVPADDGSLRRRAGRVATWEPV